VSAAEVGEEPAVSAAEVGEEHATSDSGDSDSSESSSSESSSSEGEEAETWDEVAARATTEAAQRMGVSGGDVLAIVPWQAHWRLSGGEGARSPRVQFAGWLQSPTRAPRFSVGRVPKIPKSPKRAPRFSVGRVPKIPKSPKRAPRFPVGRG
jgi:hypothetical protein